MLFFDYSITHLEMPGDICLTFYISECQNRCPDCHSQDLWKPVGSELPGCFVPLLQLYRQRISCICFLGEGRNTAAEHTEFAHLCNIARQYELKTCLYSGRDCEIEDWMLCFDFVKVGSYQKEFGPITETTTNQKMYKINNGKHIDVTHIFWSS